MPENNVAFWLERYDEICAIAFNRHSSPSSISKKLANFVGNHRHDAPLLVSTEALWGRVGEARTCPLVHGRIADRPGERKATAA